MWEPEISSWSAQERQAWLPVRDQFVHLFIFIIILDYDSCPRVAHDTHKLQTVAMYGMACHHLNNVRLESDQPIHVPSLRILSLLLSAGLSLCSVAIAEWRALHLTTTRTDTQATVLCCCS